MYKALLTVLLALTIISFVPEKVLARTPVPSPTIEATASASPVSISNLDTPRVDITQKSEESLGPLEKILHDQEVKSTWPFNFVKMAIRNAVASGIPANTIVLLLLLPLVAFLIAFSRNVIGIMGFGIFLPASLSVVFVAIGPVVGVILFLIIVAISTVVRMVLRKLKLKLQYLPRMSLILWAVVVSILSVLFLSPVINFSGLNNVSIFAVLVLILLAEDFIRVQLGKSAKTALSLTAETLILSMISYLFLTLKPIQSFVLLNPEIALLGAVIGDFVLGKYTGLRVMEFYRFRKLLKQ